MDPIGSHLMERTGFRRLFTPPTMILLTVTVSIRLSDYDDDDDLNSAKKFFFLEV